MSCTKCQKRVKFQETQKKVKKSKKSKKVSCKFPKIASQSGPRERTITLTQYDYDQQIARARSASQAPPPRQHSQPPAKRAKSSKPAKKSKTNAPAGPSKPPQVPKKRPQAAILLCGKITDVLQLDQKENERYLREQFVGSIKKWDVTFVTLLVTGENSGQDYNDALNSIKRIKKKMPTLMLVLFPQDSAIDGFMSFAKGAMELLSPASVIGVLGASSSDVKPPRRRPTSFRPPKLLFMTERVLYLLG